MKVQDYLDQIMEKRAGEKRLMRLLKARSKAKRVLSTRQGATMDPSFADAQPFHARRYLQRVKKDPTGAAEEYRKAFPGIKGDQLNPQNIDRVMKRAVAVRRGRKLLSSGAVERAFEKNQRRLQKLKYEP